MAVLLESGDSALLESGDVLLLESDSPIPQNLVLDSKTDTQIVMSWDAVSGATGYDVERDGVVIATDEAGLTYTDTPLSPSTEYDHRVRAVF